MGPGSVHWCPTIGQWATAQTGTQEVPDEHE